MATVDVTEQNFNEIAEKGIVLLDFWADWCAPCQAFEPIFAQASERHTDITFGRIDTDAQPVLTAAFQVSAVPTLMAIRDGIQVFAQPGALPAPVLEELIERVRALDMDEIRAQLAQQSEAGQQDLWPGTPR